MFGSRRRGDNLAVRIYGFEGPHELYVFDSVAAAEGDLEAIDVKNNEYVLYADDGTAISAAVRDGQVVLTPTGVRQRDQLRERLRTYLTQPSVALDPALADDPVALGGMLSERDRAREWPRWVARPKDRRRPH